MTVTEKEAANIGCLREPHAMLSGSPVFPCVASRCMAWRWSGHRRPMERGDYLPDDKANWIEKGWVFEDGVLHPPPLTHGFCGLAGTP